MITSASLKEYTLKDLAQMAKKRGITGWHSMRKNDLIQALIRDARSASKKNGSRKNGKAVARAKPAGRRNSSAAAASSRKSTTTKRGASTVSPQRGSISKVARRIQQASRQRESLKDLAGIASKPAAPRPKAPPQPPLASGKDRVVLMVRDPYWLHAHWELSRQSIQRAQAAMAEYWHSARPVLRLSEVATGNTTSTSEVHVRDIEIHGGVNNWYIDVVDPPKGYRVEIGYLASNGRFHTLAKSNTVMTPRPGSGEAVDDTWNDVAENCERIFALSGGYSSEGATDELQEVMEERLRRPIGSPMTTRFGSGADPTLDRERRFDFDVDAEMIIFGTTRSDSHVTLGGEPIKIDEDGTFRVRMSLPDRRQVVPVTSSSHDGMTQQTIVLAIERNTKVMEPVTRDANE